MKLHLHQDHALQLIGTYADSRITVGDTTYHSSLIITPTRTIADWRRDSATSLDIEDFTLLRNLEPEVVLLGTGKRMLFPPRSITRPLIDSSIGLEVMDTAAACRTYNILAGEGRNVVAGLIIESP